MSHFRAILGDCLEALKSIQPGSIDAVLTDPPYGIAFDFAKDRSKQVDQLAWGRAGRTAPVDHGWSMIEGDNRPFDPSPVLALGVPTILWGAQNFSDKLPASRGWLVWDKRDGRPSNHFGDAELAWTSLDRVVRLHSQLWSGLVRAGRENVANGPKLHPCQKPVALMQWCLEALGLHPGATILDPFMGSGTTGVACAEEGFSFVGIEKDPRYFEIAERRIGQAYAQGRLFA